VRDNLSLSRWKVTQESLENYRGLKFGLWEKLMKKVSVRRLCTGIADAMLPLQPDCKAAFSRMWQIGPVSRMYDKFM